MQRMVRENGLLFEIFKGSGSEGPLESGAV
jgi:hypothetical protein